MPATRVIVVGASAGGITAVRTLLNKLPTDIPHVAPPDYHLIIDGRHLRLTHGPREQGEPRAGSARKRQAHG